MSVGAYTLDLYYVKPQRYIIINRYDYYPFRIIFWKNNKNILNSLEDWWSIFLYGPVFDSAFASNKDYNIIR